MNELVFFLKSHDFPWLVLRHDCPVLCLASDYPSNLLMVSFILKVYRLYDQK